MNQVERLEVKLAALQMRLSELEAEPRFARRSGSAKEEMHAAPDAEVLAAVCEHVGITVEEVRGSSRTRDVCRKRAIVAAVLKLKLEWGVRQIGRVMDKDHKAVLRMLIR